MVAESKAVFLSYASEDAEIVGHLAGALTAAGLEVWLDRNELRGGDAWDQTIRQRIRDCRLFVPIISARTEARPEGYFRREWKLAVDRSLDMSSRMAFIVPIVIDATPEAVADVPDAFRSVQWIRLTDAAPNAACVERISALLAGKPAPATRPSGATAEALGSRTGPRARRPWALPALGIGVLALLGAIAGIRYARSPAVSAPVASRATRAPAGFPEKSVAVIPFTDLSEQHDQAYFSDGMAEELIDLLVKIPELRVPARSSSFYFKGKPDQLRDIASQLGVANVLEGTVRKQGTHLRVSAQLVQAATGYTLWSETYDRELHDVFKTQDEIAAAVVKALRVSLLSSPQKSEGQTHNDAAYELYLRARALQASVTTQNMQHAYADLRKAVELDPDFALAWAGIADILSNDAWNITTVYPQAGKSIDQIWLTTWARARAEARDAAGRATRLAPNLAEPHFALAAVRWRLDRDWAGAEPEIARARALAPEDTRLMLFDAEAKIARGHLAEGIQLALRAERLDPLGRARRVIATGAAASGDLAAAEQSARRFVELYPSEEDADFNLGCIQLLRGNAAVALESFRRAPATGPFPAVGPPLALDALGHHAEAESLMAAVEARYGVDMAYQISYFYAQRGDAARALDWLDRAQRQYDGGLSRLAIDPMLRKLRGNARFEEMVRTLRLND